jgi:hypothetical protein
MGSVIVLAVAVVVVALVVAADRRSPRLTRPRAATVELRIDADAVTRTLADGRSERAVWSALTEVELIRTPVKTADGATAFVVLSEDDDHGCLVPLGVGWDRELLARLATLPRFDVGRFDREMTTSKRGRQVVWRRPAQADGGVTSDGSAA